MALKPSRSFKDLSFTFSQNPLTKDLVLLKNENAIKRALLNLFSYKQGEKFFAADFGSKIPELLFETFDYVTSGLIKDEIKRLITLYEPRVNIIEIVIDLDESNYTYEIQINYTVPDSSQQISTINLSLTSSRA